MELQEKFNEFLIKVKKLSPETILCYNNYYKMINDLDFNQELINKFLKQHSVNNARGMLLNFIEFLEYESNETIDLKVPKIRKTRKTRIIKEITDDEIKTLKEFFRLIGFKEYLLFELIYQGALRCMEVGTIKVNSFLWDKWFNDTDDFIELKIIGKGDKERKVLITPAIAELLLEHIKNKFNLTIEGLLEFLRTNDGNLFNYLNTDKVYNIINRKTRLLLNRNLRPHEVRHQRATDLLSKNVDIYDIKNYLGHSSIKTTEIYVRRGEKESLDNIRKKI
jgi:integrase/recombinase XerC